MLRHSKIRDRLHDSAMFGRQFPAEFPGSGAGVPSGPTYPTVSSSVAWWDRNQYVYTDTAGTTLAPINGTVGSWRTVGGDWGSILASQSTAGNQPLLKSDGLQSVTNDYLDFSTITLVGDLTIYVVASKPDDLNAKCLFGDGTINNRFLLNNNYIYLGCNGVLSIDTLDVVYGSTIRRMRRSGSNWLYKRNGLAETTKAGSSANFPISRLLGSDNFMPSDWRFMQLVVVGKLITPGDDDDLAIIAKLQEVEPGVTGP